MTAFGCVENDGQNKSITIDKNYYRLVGSLAAVDSDVPGVAVVGGLALNF